jgi:hypothetical protein
MCIGWCHQVEERHDEEEYHHQSVWLPHLSPGIFFVDDLPFLLVLGAKI